MAVTVLPGAGQRPTAGLGEAAQTMLQFFLQREQLEQQEQQQDFRERQFEFQQQVQQTEQAQQAQAAQAGRALVANMVQQNPQLAQSIQAAFPGAQQIEVSGDPLAGDVQQTQTFDPRGIPAAAAPALAEGFQQQQLATAQADLAAAQAGEAEATTESIRGEERRAQEMFPIMQNLREAETALRSAQSTEAVASARLQQIEANTLVQRFARDAALQQQQALLQTAQTLGVNPADVSRIVLGTDTFPTAEELMEEEIRALNAFGATAEDGAEFEQQLESRRHNRLAGAIGFSRQQQTRVDELIDELDSPQSVLNTFRESAEVEDEDMARAYLYLQNRFPDAQLITEDTDPGFIETIRNFISINTNVIGGAAAGATAGGAFGGPVGAGIGGMLGATGGLGMQILPQLIPPPQQ